jgi:DNA-binding IclR family transcriptional regulator
MSTNNHIELIEKSMRILEVLAKEEVPLDLKDLTARVDMVKSSVFRILYTLRELGYVEQRGRGSYCLTAKMFALASRSAIRHSLIEVAHPHLTHLRDSLNESAWLAEWRGGRAILVDVAEARHKLRLLLSIGDPCPLHASALGKSIAAFLRPEELATVLGTEALASFTDRTITDRAQLLRELAKVRACGLATNEEETIEGAILVGAPIFDSRGNVFAAVSLSCPTARCTLQKRSDMVALVREASRSISQQLADLGFRAD